jgi:hypothetical protein
MWSHEFSQKGVYVFADSKSATKLSVIAVKAANEQCKNEDAYVQSMSIQSLSAVGIEAQPKTVEPDFAFVTAAFIFLMAFNFIFVSGFVWLA